MSERVRRVVAEQLGMELEKVTPEKTFAEDLGADSLDRVQLTLTLEEEFGLDIPDKEAEKLLTVKDAIEYIEIRARA